MEYIEIWEILYSTIPQYSELWSLIEYTNTTNTEVYLNVHSSP
jgi:hypothetical protein